MSFVDSNVFVYLFDEGDPAKRRRAREIVRLSLSQSWVVSYQVVQETLNVITRKLKTPVTADHARRFLHAVLLPLWSVAPSAELYRRGLEIQSRYQYGFYDALIIAAALEASCTRLLSEALQHGQRIDTLTIENPFLGLPRSAESND
ncbi:MAG: PIN domain-containing protein [Spirochaetaceae bacterium]|nr:PIN domain-containing protein [Spirochaetaceae bacterium]